MTASHFLLLYPLHGQGGAVGSGLAGLRSSAYWFDWELHQLYFLRFC